VIHLKCALQDLALVFLGLMLGIAKGQVKPRLIEGAMAYSSN
jgi:hypothetical protein